MFGKFCMRRFFCGIVASVLMCAPGGVSGNEKPAFKGGMIPMLAITGSPSEADARSKVAAIHAQGIESFLIYARSGLEIEYMGKEWLDVCEWLCDEAERRNMKVWLYDEYNWPSGTCKGRIPNENDQWRYSEYGVFRNADGSFRWTTALAPAGWVNVCEPKAVARFIELTHDVYAKRLGRYFSNKTICGIFTDEPGHPVKVAFPEGTPIVSFRNYSGLEEEYAAATGRNLKADVEKWIESGDGEVWATYLDLMGKRFRTAYFDQIRAWCDRHGILLTGHLICENYTFGSLRYNGNPIHCVRGMSLPGMDEIVTAIDADPQSSIVVEWVTYNLARQAVLSNGTGGLAELFACGPPAHVPATMRFMFWMCAFHGIDHYVTCMDAMDMKGLVEKHGYLSPTGPIHPWYERYENVLDAEARTAALWAKKTVSEREVAVRYSIKELSRMSFSVPETDADGKNLHERFYGLLRMLEVNQITCRLIGEDEATDLPLVFSYGGKSILREERSGKMGLTEEDAVGLCRRKLPSTFAVYEQDGALATNLLVRTYSDGSSAVLNLQPFSKRMLVAEKGGKRSRFVLPPRGVVCFGSGALPTSVASPAEERSLADVEWNLAFGKPNLRRINFDETRNGTVTVAGELKNVRIVTRACAMSFAVTTSGRPVGLNEEPPEGVEVIRHIAEPYSFAMDGKRIEPTEPCNSLRPGYDQLYRQTGLFDLAPGTHRFAISTGEADRNFFFPALFLSGDFAVLNGVLVPRTEKTVKFGTLAGHGFGDFTGTATWSANVKVPSRKNVRLRLSTGGRVTRVAFAGQDLGVRAWEPFEWELPEKYAGTEGLLEISVSTSVRPMFGDLAAGKWDSARIWCSVDGPDAPCGLLDAAWIQP